MQTRFSPIVVRGFFFAPLGTSGPTPIREAPLFCVVPLCVTALGCVVLFFFADEIYRLLIAVETFLDEHGCLVEEAPTVPASNQVEASDTEGGD